MAWTPGVRFDLVIEATPLELSGTCPMTVGPSWKVTMPVGVPAPEGREDTVAVNETACPKFDGLGEATTTVDDAFAWIFCTMVTDDAG